MNVQQAKCPETAAYSRSNFNAVCGSNLIKSEIDIPTQDSVGALLVDGDPDY